MELICIEMARTEIQIAIFASRQLAICKLQP